MTKRTQRLSRRHFLLAVGAGSAATAAAIVTTKVPRARPASRRNKRTTRGYHASEHVNNYYRTTKI